MQPDPGTQPETVFGTLTPIGRGAIAVIACRGPRALPAIDQLFTPASGRRLTQYSPGTFVYGNWSNSEDLIVYLKDDAWIEIHCHAGPASLNSIRESLESKSLQPLSSSEFTRRVSGSSWESDWLDALVKAPTKRTASLLLRSRPVTQEWLATTRQLLCAGKGKIVAHRLEQVLSWESFGTHLVQPWKVVLCGQPNVGKSSLINALVGYQRAIVHTTPGTTRDIVSETTAIDGWPISISDTAGMRDDASDQIERRGIALAKQVIASADLVIAVTDASASWSQQDDRLIDSVLPAILLHNKCDLPGQANRPAGISISALTGQGISDLVQAMADRLVPELPDPQLPLFAQPESFQRLKTCLSAVRQDQLDLALSLLE